MKNFLFSLLSLILLASCNSTKNAVAKSDEKISDTVRIANDSLQYEIIITDVGFGSWLASRAYPRHYHSLNYLVNKNRNYVQEYNLRASNPQRFGELYPWQIDYQWNTDYGYEVNYLLYNYFVFFQNKYNQRLGGNVPVR